MTLLTKLGDLHVIEQIEQVLLAPVYVKVDTAIDPGQYSIRMGEYFGVA